MQLDWRNASVDNVRATYAEPNSIHAALAMNEGSKAPDYFSGPIWAIFDRAAVERDKWNIDPPFTSPTNGYFFSADTIEELAAKIQAGHEFQRVPLTYLAETVAKWNAYVDKGSDPEFGRGPDAPMYKIDKPPFYAATLNPVWHDSYGGLRINGRAQVIDMQGEPIPGLYAGGESSGGGQPAWPGKSARPWLHRRHERRRRTDSLIWKRQTPAAAATPHTTSVVAWDIPSAIVVGERFRIKVGIKCSERVPPDEHGTLESTTTRGRRVATGTLSGDRWPGTTGLYVAEVELEAPAGEGLYTWTVKGPGSDAGIPHAEGSTSFGVRVVSHPEYLVRVEAVDQVDQTPIRGARVVMHPYHAVTDERGVAEVRVAKGAYRLFVSQTRYLTFGLPVEVTRT